VALEIVDLAQLSGEPESVIAAEDLVITGSIVQIPIAVGGHVAAAVGNDAPVTVRIV